MAPMPNDQGPMKAFRGPNDDADQWTCTKCGNLNYGSRLVCNMRKCGAPKTEEPWVCPGCGNENRAHRLFCNLRSCQLARPGLTAPAMRQAEAGGRRGGGDGFGGGGGYGGGGGFGGKGGGPGHIDERAAAPGAWRCPDCGNQNYPGRTHCNSRSCGRPAPSGFSFNGGGEGGGKGSGPKVIDPRMAEPGSWLCPACGNSNYPGRTHCNRRSCGQPAPPGVAGYARAPAQDFSGFVGGFGTASQPKGGGKQQAPEGSWICTACNNVNYPTRTTCNSTSCGKPRAAVDGGPPPTANDGPPPEGAWTCPSCQNVNYPTRSVCNRRACGLPRPAHL